MVWIFFIGPTPYLDTNNHTFPDAMNGLFFSPCFWSDLISYTVLSLYQGYFSSIFIHEQLYQPLHMTDDLAPYGSTVKILCTRVVTKS